MKQIGIFGASGGLAEFLINDFLEKECYVDAITRRSSKSTTCSNKFSTNAFTITHPGPIKRKFLLRSLGGLVFFTIFDT